MKILFFQLFQVLIQRLPIGFVNETIFNVDFIEEANHVFGLIFGGIEFLYSIEDHRQDDLMG